MMKIATGNAASFYKTNAASFYKTKVYRQMRLKGRTLQKFLQKSQIGMAIGILNSQNQGILLSKFDIRSFLQLKS